MRTVAAKCTKRTAELDRFVYRAHPAAARSRRLTVPGRFVEGGPTPRVLQSGRLRGPNPAATTASVRPAMTTSPSGSPARNQSPPVSNKTAATHPQRRRRLEIDDSDALNHNPKRARNGFGTLPDNPLAFYKEPRGTTQIATWNVAGLRSCNAEKWKVQESRSTGPIGDCGTDPRSLPPPVWVPAVRRGRRSSHPRHHRSERAGPGVGVRE